MFIPLHLLIALGLASIQQAKTRHLRTSLSQPIEVEGPIPAVIQAPTLDPSKLAWLHTPKAGTSFANVLIAWGCPEFLGNMSDRHHAAIANNFCKEHGATCPISHSLCSSHSPITFSPDGNIHSWANSKGQFVGMFRNPEQRHISGFQDDQLMSTFGVEIIRGQYETALDYARANAGCSVKLLAGKPCNDRFAATEVMLSEAKLHLDNGFAYAGLTEEWELSVCLFHRMFGGECHADEFLNVRPGIDREREDYDTSVLKGWVDPFDGPLYDHARFLFWSNIAKYDVSWETCRTTVCPSVAEYFEM